MGVVMAMAATLAASGLIAAALVRVPRFGLNNYPRASLFAASVALVVGAAVLVIEIGAPLSFGMAASDLWPVIVTDYFLAAANRLVGGGFAFFWTPHWIYSIGSLTPLIPLAAIVAIATGWSARRYAPRTVCLTVAVAGCMLIAFVVGGVYAAAATWDGIPL